MQYSNVSSEQKSVWYQTFTARIAKTSMFFLQVVFFLGAALIGIARYAYAAPIGLTVFMTIWSIVLLLHGIVTWRKASATETGQDGGRDGILKTVFFASGLNAIMWVMWSLATDARNAAPFHMTVLLALIAGSVSALLIGKRMLYAHWQSQFLRDHPVYDQEMKAKRGEHSLEDMLSEDGELTDHRDEASNRRLEER